MWMFRKIVKGRCYLTLIIFASAESQNGAEKENIGLD